LARKSKPPLTLVTPTAAKWPKPPRDLGEHGRALWDQITREYLVEDSGGIEMLMQACEAQDRIGRLREQINADGEVIHQRGTIKEHPGLKIELALRSFVVRTLQRLGLNYEPVRSSAGRPGQGIGWQS
jgi:hypothetical protein